MADGYLARFWSPILGSEVLIDPRDVEVVRKHSDGSGCIHLKNGESNSVKESYEDVKARLALCASVNRREELNKRLEQSQENVSEKGGSMSNKLVLALTDGSVVEVPASRVLAIVGQPRGECRVDVLEAVEKGEGENRVKSDRIRMYQVAEPFDVVSARLKQVKDESSRVEDSESNVLTLTDGSRVCVRREDVLFISQSMAEGVTVGLKDGTKYSVKDWQQDIHDWFERGISEANGEANEPDSDTDDTSSRVKVAPTEDSEAESCKDDTPMYEVTTITSSLVDSEDTLSEGAVVKEYMLGKRNFSHDGVIDALSEEVLCKIMADVNSVIKNRRDAGATGLLTEDEIANRFDVKRVIVSALLQLKQELTGYIQPLDETEYSKPDGIWRVNLHSVDSITREIVVKDFLRHHVESRLGHTAERYANHEIYMDFLALLCDFPREFIANFIDRYCKDSVRVCRYDSGSYAVVRVPNGKRLVSEDISLTGEGAPMLRPSSLLEDDLRGVYEGENCWENTCVDGNDSPKETPSSAAGSVVYLEREEWNPDALRYVDDKVYEFETVRLLKVFLKYLNRKIETGSKQAGVLRVAEFSELFDLAPFHVRTLLEIKRTVTGLIGRVTDNGVEPNWEGVGEEWVVNPNPPDKFDREVNAYLYIYRLFGQKFIESAFFKNRHCSIDPEYVSLLCNVSVEYVHGVMKDAMRKTFYLNLNSEGNYELVGRENK